MHTFLPALALFASPLLTASGGGFDREGWIARIPPGIHEVQAIARMVDERTIQIDHFSYDGGAPLVYFYLGAFDSYQSYVNGLEVGPLLDRAYEDESLTVTLPEDESLGDYQGISVWCAEFLVNFGSAPFTCAADFDLNFVVDTADLVHLLGAWGGPCEECPADIDQSGAVDFADLITLLGEWGTCF